MASPASIYLCAKLAQDSDAAVREIGQRCMREFDEFALMKYARLTGQDEACLARAARSAREGDEVTRAETLEAGAEMVRRARNPREVRATAGPPARLGRGRRVAG